MKRIFLCFMTLAATFVLVAGCSHKTTKEQLLKIGINVWPGYGIAFIAEEKGFFKKNGADVELVFRKEQSDTCELFSTGALDGVFEVLTDTIFHNAEGISSKVVLVVDYSTEGDVVIGKPEFNSIADLKEKKIGVDGINSFSHFFVLKLLEKNGLSEFDVRFDIVKPLEMVDALDSGKVDAGHTWEPAKSEALKKGYKVLGEAGDVPGAIMDVLSFKAEVIEARREEVFAIVKSLTEALGFISSNRDEALGIISRRMGMSRESLESGLNGLHCLDISENADCMTDDSCDHCVKKAGKAIVDFSSNRGQLSKGIDLENMVDPQFVEQLKKEIK